MLARAASGSISFVFSSICKDCCSGGSAYHVFYSVFIFFIMFMVKKKKTPEKCVQIYHVKLNGTKLCLKRNTSSHLVVPGIVLLFRSGVIMILSYRSFTLSCATENAQVNAF